MVFEGDTFNYVHNSDLKSCFSIKIGSLEGVRPKPTYKELLKEPVLYYSGRNQDCSDLFVECQIFADGRHITLPIVTSYKPFTTRWNWNEWLEFPIRFCDLPRDAILLITIYDYESPRKRVVVGGTSISLFGKDGVFPRGLHDLRVWMGMKADPFQTPGKGPNAKGGNDQMYRLNKLVKKHESGQIPRIDWLDRLVFREIEVINDKEKRSSNFMYLMIEFPRVENKGVFYHIIWWENTIEPDNYYINKFHKDMALYDPEIGLENLHESKHHHLARSLQSGVMDRDLKPNSTNRDILLNITQYPPTRQLTSDEQDLIWKYRFFLSNQKKGLPKFLKCVNWNLEKEAQQAMSLLYEWSPPDAHDALELLGPEFTNPEIRKYAVDRLDSASDDELLLYLLQLVQALRYEAYENKSWNLLDVSHYSIGSDSSIGTDNFLIEPLPPVSSVPSANILKSGCDDSIKQDTTEWSSKGENENLQSTLSLEGAEQKDLFLEGNPFENSCQDLASFLINRACKNSILANYLYWYLLIECEDKSTDEGLKQESKVKYLILLANIFNLSAITLLLHQ